MALSREEVERAAKALDYPFIDEWKLEYPDEVGLKKIRFKSDYTGRYNVFNRIRRGVRVFFKGYYWWRDDNRTLKDRFMDLYYNVKLDNNITDVLVNGNPVFWHEVGLYMMAVRPKVGEILMQMLTDRPDDEYSQRIAGEILVTLEEMNAHSTMECNQDR